MDPKVLKKLNQARRNREACILVTNLNDGRDRLIMATDADNVPGLLGAEICKSLAAAKATTIEIDGHSFFLNPHVPAFNIVVVGAVHIAQALVKLADIVDLKIEIIDPRSAFASSERFPGAKLYADWPEEVLAQRPLDVFTALITVSHDPKIDDFPLKAALDAGCLYVGALGSHKTHAARLERLKEMGVSDEDLGRISAPIGLDIGAATPAEIATSIMAEIILTLRGKKGQ